MTDQSGMKQSIFLNNLEQWIDAKISQNGLTDVELVRTIKTDFERAMRANIEHHRFVAKSENDRIKADRHKLMADVYQALLNT